MQIKVMDIYNLNPLYQFDYIWILKCLLIFYLWSITNSQSVHWELPNKNYYHLINLLACTIIYTCNLQINWGGNYRRFICVFINRNRFELNVFCMDTYLQKFKMKYNLTFGTLKYFKQNYITKIILENILSKISNLWVCTH